MEIILLVIFVFMFGIIIGTFIEKYYTNKSEKCGCSICVKDGMNNCNYVDDYNKGCRNFVLRKGVDK